MFPNHKLTIFFGGSDRLGRQRVCPVFGPAGLPAEVVRPGLRCLKNEHANCRAKHNQRRHTYHDPTQHRTWLVVHKFTIGCRNQNPDEQEWRDQAIDDCCPEESFNGINIQKIHQHTDKSRSDNNLVKTAGRTERFVQSSTQLQYCGDCVSGWTSQRGNGKKSDADNPTVYRVEAKTPASGLSASAACREVSIFVNPCACKASAVVRMIKYMTKFEKNVPVPTSSLRSVISRGCTPTLVQPGSTDCLLFFDLLRCLPEK